jgi:hypothetical protein
MSKITVEQITNAAKEACNSFPYFKHGFSATPPHDITEDLDAAIKVNELLPDIFDEVSCDTSDNIVGTFKFQGIFKNSKGNNIPVDVHVDRYDVAFSGRPSIMIELMQAYLNKEPRSPVEPVTSYADVIQRDG